MFLCRVAVGEYQQGKEGQIAPDERDKKKHIPYDSTTDTMDDDARNIFVTFHDAQACEWHSFATSLIHLSVHVSSWFTLTARCSSDPEYLLEYSLRAK